MIVPNTNELWGFGDYKDKQGGLWATVIVLDGKPDETYRHAENGDQLGTRMIVRYSWFTTVFIDKHTWQWVAGNVVQVRRDHDSLLAIDMVWKVDPGGEDGDEHPEQMTEKERFCVCNIIPCVF